MRGTNCCHLMERLDEKGLIRVNSPIRRLEDHSGVEYHDVIGANLDLLGVDSL